MSSVEEIFFHISGKFYFGGPPNEQQILPWKDLARWLALPFFTRLRSAVVVLPEECTREWLDPVERAVKALDNRKVLQFEVGW